MAEAYIVAAARTAGGRKGGRLAGWHPADLAAKVLDSLVERSGAAPDQIEDVIMGCVMQAGEQSNNIARNAIMASKLPESVPGTSIDRQCGSSQQALHFAAQAVMSGTMDIVIAAGVESMTRVPMGLASQLPAKNGFGHYKSPGIEQHYPNIVFSQFTGAEMMAREIRALEGRARRVFLQQPPARDRGDAGRPLQERDRAGADHPRRRLDRHPHHRRRHPLRRQPRRHQGRQADRRERQADGGERQPDLRRRLRRGRGQREGPEAARRQAAGAHPSPDHDGRRSRDHAGRAAARDRARAEEGRHERSTTSTCSRSTRPLPRCRPRG